MPVLSIIACKMLEDEIAHLLTSDRGVREILLVDEKESMSLSRKLKAQSRPHILLAQDSVEGHIKQAVSRQRGIFSWRSGRSAKADDLVVVVSLLRLGLHSNLEHLKAAVYDNIRSLSTFSDGILIFYGKCGDSLADLQRDFADLSCPLYFLTDEKDERVDDCIAVALGGNENYDCALTEHQDVALFMTPMWAANWNAMGQEGVESGRRLDLRAMLKGTAMNKVARIDTGLSFEKGFYEKVDSFSREFGLETIKLPGTITLAEKSYRKAKICLMSVQNRSVPSSRRICDSDSREGVESILELCQRTWNKLLG